MRLRILALGMLLLGAPVAPVLRCAECCLGRMEKGGSSAEKSSGCCAKRSHETKANAPGTASAASVRAGVLPSDASCACLVGESAASLELCVSLPEAPKATAFVVTLAPRIAFPPDCGRAHTPVRSPSLRC